MLKLTEACGILSVNCPQDALGNERDIFQEHAYRVYLNQISEKIALFGLNQGQSSATS